jgi:hypothetical protein
MVPDDPIPPRDAPIADIYDWHYLRSIADGIDPYDADILAENFATRYAR